MIPGEVIAMAGEIELNAGCLPLEIEVANTGDRPDPSRQPLPFR